MNSSRDNSGQTALTVAMVYGKKDMAVELLKLDKGDVNVKDFVGCSVFYLANKKGNNLDIMLDSMFDFLRREDFDTGEAAGYLGNEASSQVGMSFRSDFISELLTFLTMDVHA